MAASDPNDRRELAGLARGFAAHVKRSVRLGLRLRRPAPAVGGVGLLFVGVDVAVADHQAVKLLDNMIAAMGWPRDQVDVLPAIDEATLAKARPAVVVILGHAAGIRLLGDKAAAPDVRGAWLRWGDVDLMLTYHPDELLEKIELKRAAWQDLKAVMARCDALGLSPRTAP